MRKLLDIFRITREERLPAIVMLIILVAMNGLLVAHYYGVFTPLSDDYWSLFIKKFAVSGFDPITYYVASSWEARYNVYRHPLLSFYMYVPYLINRGLMWLTGINCALFIVAAMQVTWSFYSFVFMRRIMSEVVGLRRNESTLLAFLLFGFAYVMLSAIVPDHFMFSMLLLLISLYISGVRMAKGRTFKVWQSVLYFLLTAGTSLNNGLKIFLCGLFVNGKRFFSLRYLLLAVALPAAFIWGLARLEYHYMVLPGEQQRHKAKIERQKEQRKKETERKAKEEAERKTVQMQPQKSTASPTPPSPSTQPASPTTHRPKTKRQIQGKPLAKGEFTRWTDITTSRTESIVENLFGESIQLHTEHLLQDIMRRRPMFVHYTYWWNYAVEALVAMLFIAGVWMGRRSRFLWLAMSFFLLDMLLHVVLGFGLNEVYIMTAHWIYVIPIAMGFLLRGLQGRWRTGMGIVVSLLTAYLFIYNVSLIAQYLL
jgi:hypothetical protein